MTLNEFFEQHQDNKSLIIELDEVLNILKKENDGIPYFAIHMRQLGQNLYSNPPYIEDKLVTNKHKELLNVLVDIGVVDKFPSRHKDDQETYKIKSVFRNSKPLIKQLSIWKNKQTNLEKPVIVENYSNSNVVKGSNLSHSSVNHDIIKHVKESPHKNISKTTSDSESPKLVWQIIGVLVATCSLIFMILKYFSII